ncbi:hypothetical protein WJ967_00635 [Achromobacter xylosoxidans]
MRQQLHQVAAIERQLAQPALGRRHGGNAQRLAKFGKRLGEVGV